MSSSFRRSCGLSTSVSIVSSSLPALVLPYAKSGLGLLLDSASSMPGTTFYSGLASKIGLAYYSSSTFLNVTLMSMICYQLLSHARAVKQYFGDKHASPYITIVALVVESVLPFTLSSIAFLVSYGMGSQSAVVFSFIHPLVMVRSTTFESAIGANEHAVHLTTDADPPRCQGRGVEEGRKYAHASRIDHQDSSWSFRHVEPRPFWWEWSGRAFGDITSCA